MGLSFEIILDAAMQAAAAAYQIITARGRHCEERSDEAIQLGALGWIASLRSQ
ncbi:hypothetical protein KQX62_08170 [Rhodopseudomonas palustris]|uniref:Uncharacterized protein n=1 Tax=Rhodopseudomonas palustris TaxID=1076 RepID=A0AAX3E392_RHOPL|nr:hypothetical protein [Rhodopseudomonas palustris]UYO41254.1 hypothetical protein KQX62_08170 [Rhodopseudomonas palustris]